MRINPHCAPLCRPFRPAMATATLASWRALCVPWPSRVHAPIELHLFSDMQRGDLAATFSDMALPANVKLVTHAVVAQAQPNWTVESVDAPGQVWGKDAKPVHVQAVIAGYGTPAAQRTVSLVVNGKTAATKPVVVPANGRATVEFPALEVPYGFSRCEVKIDAADGFPADDLRRFAVERSDPQKALLIHNYGDTRSPLYVNAALSAAAQSTPSPSNRSTSTRPPTANRPITRSLFFPISIRCLRFWRTRSPSTCAPAAVSSSPRAPTRAAACRFPFSARTSWRPATTTVFPIDSWRSAPATLPTRPWPKPVAGPA